MQASTSPGNKRLLDQLVLFSRQLHDAGVAVNSSNLIDLCNCIPLIDISKKLDFYASARSTLISNQQDIPIFDQIFTQFWSVLDEPESSEEDDDSPKDIDSEEQEEKELIENSPQETNSEDQEQPQPEKMELSYSPDELLMKKDFETMSKEEIEQARRLIAELVSILANYQSRRRINSRKGSEFNLRKMLRQNALYGQDGIDIMFRKRSIKKTKLLLLCDVSGSMERYSRFLIQFIYAMRQQLASLDVAVFSTSMTIITEHLRKKNIEESLQQVSENVHDWAGGTKIGESLRGFNEKFSRDMRNSHTVVIILSDGWDRGDPDLMKEEMAQLHRQVHKLLWLNPLLGNDNYQPLCKGMQTALPYIDHFLPAHNLASFADLLKHLRTVWN